MKKRERFAASLDDTETTRPLKLKPANLVAVNLSPFSNPIESRTISWTLTNAGAAPAPKLILSDYITDKLSKHYFWRTIERRSVRIMKIWPIAFLQLTLSLACAPEDDGAEEAARKYKSSRSSKSKYKSGDLPQGTSTGLAGSGMCSGDNGKWKYEFRFNHHVDASARVKDVEDFIVTQLSTGKEFPVGNLYYKSNFFEHFWQKTWVNESESIRVWFTLKTEVSGILNPNGGSYAEVLHKPNGDSKVRLACY